MKQSVNYKGYKILTKNDDQTIEFFNKSIERDSEDSEAYRNKSLILKKQKNYQEAIECLNKIIELKPNDPVAYCDKALILKEQRNYPEAIKVIDRIIELEPNNLEPYHTKILILEGRRKFQEAIEVIDKIIELESNDPDLHCKKGSFYLELGQKEKSILCFEEAIQLDSKNPNIYCQIANILKSRVGICQEMLEYCERAIKVDSKCGMAYNLLGWVNMNNLKLEEALIFFDKAIKLNYIESYYNKAFTLEKDKRYLNAIECLNELINIIDPSEDIYLEKAKQAVSGISEKFQEEFKYFDELISSEPNNPCAYLNRSIFLRKNNSEDRLVIQDLEIMLELLNQNYFQGLRPDSVNYAKSTLKEFVDSIKIVDLAYIELLGSKTKLQDIEKAKDLINGKILDITMIKISDLGPNFRKNEEKFKDKIADMLKGNFESIFDDQYSREICKKFANIAFAKLANEQFQQLETEQLQQLYDDEAIIIMSGNGDAVNIIGQRGPSIDSDGFELIL